MYQVLFHIPVKLGWLPDFLPLPLVVLLVVVIVFAGLWCLAPREPLGYDAESVRNFAKWLGGFGVAIAGLMYAASHWWPDGIPVHGFGMMLFIAFLLCNWVAGLRAAGVTFLTIATGPKRGKDYLAETFPADERVQRGKDVLQDLSVALFIGGLLGARVTYLVRMIQDGLINSLWEFLVQLPMIWEGGIIFYGSMIGAFITFLGCYAFFYFRRNIRISAFKLADIAAPCLALGLCLGRIGCLLNGCCYGQVACADCAVLPIHFPLSAPARPNLVREGYQTAAGFTLAEDQPDWRGVYVGEVAPGSSAFQAGLRPGDFLVEVTIDGRTTELKRDTKVLDAGTPKQREAVLSPEENLSYVLSPQQWPRGGRELTLTTAVPDPDDPNSLEFKETHHRTFVPHTIGLLPTQIYESISMFLLFWLLLAWFPLRSRDGQVMALLMICYAVHRYLNEQLRDDPRPEGFEKYGSIALFGLGVALWLWLLYSQRPLVKKN